MKSVFGRHHVRANFYHFVSLLYVLTMCLWGIGVISDVASTLIGFTLFAVDYLAQMYDPHPNNPGPWFKRHFHRFMKDDEDPVPVEGISSNVLAAILWMVGIVLLYFVSAYIDILIQSITT